MGDAYINGDDDEEVRAHICVTTDTIPVGIPLRFLQRNMKAQCSIVLQTIDGDIAC